MKNKARIMALQELKNIVLPAALEPLKKKEEKKKKKAMPKVDDEESIEFNSSPEEETKPEKGKKEFHVSLSRLMADNLNTNKAPKKKAKGRRR